MDNFQGRTAVITGAASGIGLAMARRFRVEGANVVLADIEADALNSVLPEFGEAAIGVLTDVSDQSQLQHLHDVAVERFGPIHVLCNNAGVCTTGRVEEQTDEQWDWVLDVNLRSVIWGCRIFLPGMKAHGEPAHIVNTGSMAGLVTGPFMAPYFVTKFGVVALSEAMWNEAQIDGSNVGVSVLCPGFVRTKIGESDRNSPAGIQAWVAADSSAGHGLAEQLTAGVEAGMEPDDVAAEVVSAIAEGRLWILTHDDYKEAVRQRAATITGSGLPATPTFG